MFALEKRGQLVGRVTELEERAVLEVPGAGSASSRRGATGSLAMNVTNDPHFLETTGPLVRHVDGTHTVTKTPHDAAADTISRTSSTKSVERMAFSSTTFEAADGHHGVGQSQESTSMMAGMSGGSAKTLEADTSLLDVDVLLRMAPSKSIKFSPSLLLEP